MATVEKGKIRGTVGGKIYSIDPVTNKQIVRSKPKKTRNPRTKKQQAHRNAFVDIVRLSSHMTEAHTIGLLRHAQRAGLRTYADFRRLNKGCFSRDGRINYSRIVLSLGSVPAVETISAQLDADFTLHVTFDSGVILPQATPEDEFYLYAYCPAMAVGYLAPPVPRSAGELSVQLPAEWWQAKSDTQVVHLYAFLRNRNGKTSTTIYIPQAE